jgi:undecaprenyl-diphosphatase
MNYEAFQWINNAASHYTWLDTSMVFITNSVPYVVIALFVYLWFGSKEQHMRAENQYTALQALFAAIFGLLMNEVIHLVYYHPRPFIAHHVHQLIAHSNDSSFVSDHAVLVFSVAFALILHDHSLKYIFFVWACIAGISRVFVGVHYPADVIGGLLVGLIANVVIVRFIEHIEPLFQFVFRLYARIAAPFPFLRQYSSDTKHE